MKKLSLLLLVVIAIMGLTACGNKAENTAKSFFKALETQDFDTAKKLATEDGQQLLTLIQSMSESAPEEQKAELTKKRYNVLETIVEGDSATVKYEEYSTDNPDDKTTQELQMLKVEGSWKVHFAKDDIQK